MFLSKADVCSGVFSLKLSSYHFGGLLISSVIQNLFPYLSSKGSIHLTDWFLRFHGIIYISYLTWWRKSANKQYSFLPSSSYWIFYQLSSIIKSKSVIPWILSHLKSLLPQVSLIWKLGFWKQRKDFCELKGKVCGHKFNLESNFLIPQFSIISLLS